MAQDGVNRDISPSCISAEVSAKVMKLRQDMDILLVIPPGGYYAERWKEGSLQPPLGVLYLAAALEQNDISVQIIDAYLEKDTYKSLADKVKTVRPKIIGISFCTDNRFQAFETVRTLKKECPNVPIVAGGPHPSLATLDTLEHVREIDYIVRGEGEISFVELAQALLSGKDTDSIAGIAYRKDQKPVINQSREFVSRLDDLPFPARHLIPWDKYCFTMEVPGRGSLRGATLLASRGCPFACNFCSSSEMWGRKNRRRSPRNIIQEIEQLIDKFRVQALWFLDDVFATNKQHGLELCNAMLEAKIDLPWLCEIRVDIADFHLLETFKKSGCFCVGFGVESGSQRILDKVVNKKISIEKVKQVRDWCEELDLISNPFFIYSHPNETEEDLNMTMDLIRTWPKKSWIGLKLLHIYPGTEVEKIALAKAMLPNDFSWAKPLDSRVEVLPSTQGDVPLFRDKLSWDQLGTAMLEWSRIKKYPIWKSIPRAMRDIRSFEDVKRYAALAKSFIRFKLGLRVRKSRS